jgi:uncharacterized protein (DUF1501 family)
MKISRRMFVRGGAVAMMGVGSAPAWLARAASANGTGNRRKVLVVVFQRGAMDGLNALVPFGEKLYYDLRPTLAVPQPGKQNGCLDLDGFFGLHPALTPLHKLYQARQLAVVPGTGSPDPTRSHFDAQDYMESGTPGRKSTADGWLNRALPQPAAPSPVSPLRAVSMGTQLARALRGRNAAVAVSTLQSFEVKDTAGAMAFEKLYAGSADKQFHAAGKETFEAVKLAQSVARKPYQPAGGAAYPASSLGQSLLEIAKLIKAGVGLEVAFADTTGWDTHVNQAGPFTNLLTDFARSLAAFHQDMGDRMGDEVMLVTMSEFGRTAKENGNRGTDHGHGNVMFALGGGVHGGVVHGNWPGLEREQLWQGRDLAVTTDFRDVLSETVRHHLGVADTGRVFPGHTPKPLSLFT